MNTMTASPEGQDLKVSRIVKASPQRVFDALSKPELITQWFGCNESKVAECRFEGRVGGTWSVSFENTGEGCFGMDGEVLAYDPPSLLRYSWNSSHPKLKELPASTVEFQLTGDGDSTMIELFHRGLPEGEMQACHNEGWTQSLAKLAAALEK